MKRKTYPIFISYRHSDTADKAEHLLSLLEAAGYKNRVSFDRENLDGRFDQEILRRLDTCTDFIIILGTETLAHINDEEFGWYNKLATCTIELFSNLEDEFLAEKSLKRKASHGELREADKHIDFVRLEIARAIAKGKNIIPVVPVNTDEYNFDEHSLPEDIYLLNKYQAVKYQDSKDFLFKDILDKILKRLKTPLPHPLIRVSILALSVMLFLLGAISLIKWNSENALFHQLRTQSDFERFKDGSWFFGNQCADSIKLFNHLKGDGLASINDSEHTNGNDSIFVAWNPDCTLNQIRVLRQLLNHMMFVPKGSFTMGTNRMEGYKNTPHDVTINSDFYLGKFEVSEREWNVVINNSSTGSEDIPKTEISWDDCIEFINTLKVMTGLKFSMPTEEQWEYAASFPLDKVSLYAGGNDPDDVAVYNTNAPQKKGTKKPNEREIYDLSGNVAEWCYSDDLGKKPIRGGSYLSTADEVTITFSDKAIGASKAIGMRLMLIK